ncbi:MAG: sigma-70 family RNA polymerase sigma factor [Bacilli bacterium]
MISNYSLDEVIKENENLIKSICHKYTNYSDKEDLYQVGVIGLIYAYNNFDPKFNVKFSTYAFPYIVGEVSKFVRENNSLKLSRDLVRLGRKIKEYIDKYLQVRGYEPSTLDIAYMLEIDEIKVINGLIACEKVKSFDEAINDNGKVINLYDVLAKEENISDEQLLDLKEAFSYLNEKEKELIINRYFKDLTQNELAKLTGVNQVSISRLEKKVLSKMKTHLTK